MKKSGYCGLEIHNIITDCWIAFLLRGSGQVLIVFFLVYNPTLCVCGRGGVPLPIRDR